MVNSAQKLFTNREVCMKVLVAGLDGTTITFLREHGIAVEKQDIEDAEDLASWVIDGAYDAGVIDLEKSGLGIYAARTLRSKKIVTPIAGVTVGKTDQSWGDYRSMFLENGGDDLLHGPVNPRELTASLRAVTRRFSGSLLDVYELTSNGTILKVNLTTRSISVNGTSVYMPEHENRLLMLLASAPGRVLSKEMLLTQMYGDYPGDEPEMKIIDVFICKLRRKLADVDVNAGKFIETVWGRGYILPAQSESKKPAEKAA